jgi:hypothetical protein
MMNKNGYTPREAAYAIVIDWIRVIYNEGTVDIDDMSTTHLGNQSEAFKKELKRQLVILHDKLLSKSNLDGLPLGE